MPTWKPPLRSWSRLIRAGAVVAWMAVIFAMSSVPGSRLPGGYSVQGHLIEYAVLGGLVLFAITPELPAGGAPWAALAIAGLYGVTDEVHQAFVPGRMPDPVDWATDIVGASVGVAVVLVLLARASERRAAARRAC